MAQAGPTSEMDLRGYLSVIWRRRLVIALAVGAAVLVTLASSLVQAAVYEASSELVFQDQTPNPFTTTTAVQIDQGRVVQTEIEVITSSAVQDRVRLLLGAAPPVDVTPLGSTDAVQITAQSTGAEQAADIANAYALSYIEVKKSQAVEELGAASSQIQAKIDDLQGQIDEIDNQVDEAPADGRDALIASLSPARNALVSQQGVFRQQLDRLQVSAALEAGGAQVSSPATLPTEPVSPKPARNVVLATAVGLILGLGAALLLEYLDDSVNTKEDLDEALGAVPTLGLIPVVPGWKARDAQVVAALSDPNSPVAEAYRSLRTSVQFLGFGRRADLIEITSPNPGEGKTTTTANLAVTLAEAGRRVCVVGADLRRPRVHRFFGLPDEVGFTSVVTGEASLSAALQDVAEVDGLTVLTAGPLPPNPSELLAADRADEVLIALRARFDTVLVDAAPVLPVTDAVALAPRFDAVLLVVSAGSTKTRAVERAAELLGQVDAPLAGVVLNNVTAEGGGYGPGYGHYRSQYRAAPPPPPGSPSPEPFTAQPEASPESASAPR